MGAFIISPLPFLLVPTSMCSKVPSLHGHYPTSSLLRTWPSPSRLPRRLPGWAGYTTALLHRFLGGARTVSPVAQHILVTVLSLTTPPECHAASVSLRRVILPSPDFRGLGLRIYSLSRPPLGSPMLRPGDSLTIL